MSDHIVTAYDAELDALHTTIAEMAGLVEDQLIKSIDSVAKRDEKLSEECQEIDKKVDALEEEVESQVLRLLALRQPVAMDLRLIVSALKISNDLERMGDYATNVARRATALSHMPEVGPIKGIVRMGRLTHEIIADIVSAYVEGNVEQAVKAWRRDEEVDQMYTSLFREMLTYMMEDPRNITPCAHLLFVAKNIERIGDHGTNIAETIHFKEVGTRLEEKRPKADQSSMFAVSSES